MEWAQASRMRHRRGCQVSWPRSAKHESQKKKSMPDSCANKEDSHSKPTTTIFDISTSSNETGTRVTKIPVVKSVVTQSNVEESNVASTDSSTCHSLEVIKDVTSRDTVVKSTGSQTQPASTYVTQRRQNSPDGCVASYVQVNYRGKERQDKESLSMGKNILPKHIAFGFREDGAEFVSDLFEAREVKGKFNPSVQESTVDGSIVKCARRSYASRISPHELDFFLNTAGKSGGSNQDPFISLDELGLKTEQHKYKCSQCEFMSQSHADVEDHIMMEGQQHTEAVVVVLLSDHAPGKTCPICSMKLQGSRLFKHIRCCHGSSFPLRCGYCVFLGQDYNQLRHHIKKKHKTSEYQIIDIPRILAAIDHPGEAGCNEEENACSTSQNQQFVCPLCEVTLKTLSNLKKHIMKHSQRKQKCMLCPFTTNFPTQIRSHYRRKHPTRTPRWQTTLIEKGASGAIVEDVTPILKHITTKYGIRQPNKDGRWIRQYRCPHCDYTCSFNSSYNRHLRVHDGIKPYKCGYCDFHAREAYVVRNHNTKVHKDKPPIVENGKTLKAPYRYALKRKRETQDLEKYMEEEELNMSNWNITDGYPLPLESPVEEENESTSVSVKKVSSRFCQTLKQKSLSQLRLLRALISSEAELVGDKQKDSTIKFMKTEYQGQNCQIIKDNSTKVTSVAENLHSESSTYETKSASNKPISSPKGIQYTNKHLPTEKSTLSSVVKKICSNEQDDSESHENSIQLVKPRNTSTGNLIDKTNNVECPVTQTDNVMLKNNVDESNTVENTCKLNGNLKVHETLQNESVSIKEETPCHIYLSESDMNSFSQNVITIKIDSEKLLLPIILSEPIVTQEHGHSEHNINANNTPINSIHLDKNSCKRIFISSVQSNTLPGSSSLVSGSPIRITNNEKEPCKISLQKTSEGETVVNGKRSVQNSAPSTEVGLENNLHTHIAFLADSREQRLNSTVSVTPGVMTRDHLRLDYTNNDYFSSKTVRSMMKRKKNGQVTCNECGATTTYRAFYKHAKKHFNIKPFKCGYCSYRSIEKSKIRVHNTFCHSNNPCIILKLSPENAILQSVPAPTNANVSATKPRSETSSTASSTVEIEDYIAVKKSKGVTEYKRPHISDNSILSVMNKNSLELIQEVSMAPKTKSGGKTSRNKKVIHLENECNNLSCSSDLPAEDQSQRSQLYQCSVCLKFMKKHTPSIRRHLYSHFRYKPYKCGYCSFTGSGQTEVRAHHVTHGSATPPKVESSGIPMPEELAPHIRNIPSRHRPGRPTQKKETEAYQQSSSMLFGKDDAVSKPSNATTHSSLREVYLTPQRTTEPSFVSVSEQNSLDAPAEDTLPTFQAKGPEDLASETAFAVQALESDGTTSSSLPSHLNLNMVTDSHSDIDSNPVCVVYFIE